jgi:hypothetical protein
MNAVRGWFWMVGTGLAACGAAALQLARGNRRRRAARRVERLPEALRRQMKLQQPMEGRN